MKVIPKMQQGGSFLSLFADYNYIPNPQAPQQQGGRGRKEPSEETEKGKLTEKDLFSMLKDVDGLPNETQEVMNQIREMYQSVSLFGSNSFSGVSDIADMYAEILSKIKTLNFNKNEYDKAYKEVQQNQGLNEFAINGAGQIFAYDEDGKQSWVSVKDYLNNQDKYRAITNSELLQFRAYNPNLVYENSVLNVINNGIGISKVAELIRNNMRSLGEYTDSITGYSAKAGKQVMQGLKVLDDLESQGQIQGGMMTLDGLYQTKVITKDQQKQAEAALQYIYQALPNNAKTILQIHSGDAKNPNKGALETIWNLISSTRSDSHTVENTYQKDLNIDGSKKSSSDDSSSLQNKDLTTPELFLQGHGQKEEFMISMGTGVSKSVQTSMMPLTKANGNLVGPMSSVQEIAQGQYGPILNLPEATMGGRKIKMENLDQVLSEDGNIRMVDFPVNDDGTPDLRPVTLENKAKADKLMEESGIDVNDPQSRLQNATRINEILQECNLPAAYDKNGDIVFGKWATFGVLKGIADGRALGISDMDGSGAFLQEVDDDATINSYKQKFHDASGLSDNKEYEFSKPGIWDSIASLWGGSDGDRFFKGDIWIPLNQNYFNAKVGGGSKISGKNAVELEKLQQIRDRREELLHSYNDGGWG